MQVLPYHILGLFHKMMRGDDRLLELAGKVFAAAGMGAEVQGGVESGIMHDLDFAPRYPLASCHLPRGLDLMNGWWPREIARLAAIMRGRISGFIVHDQWEAQRRFHDYLELLRQLDASLAAMPGAPKVFIEYAVGLDPNFYHDLLASIQELEMISGCLDIGHLGIHYIRDRYTELVPGKDPCDFRPDHPMLPMRIELVVEAVTAALPLVVDLACGIAALGKPLHFHLHDCHPLSSVSPYGVSDHLSFLNTIILPFEHNGCHTLPLMYGRQGLIQLIGKVRKYLDWQKLCFSLEIHPVEGRLPLGEFASLFQHWSDMANAERMHFWINTLAANARLLTEVCAMVDSLKEESEN